MNRHLTADYFHSRGLAPFQAEFARDFCAPESPAHWELIAPVGTGKTYLAKELVTCQLEFGARKVLVLAPQALLGQWQHALGGSTETMDPLLVDRRTYLELQSAVPSGQSPWPDPALILISIDLAKRPYMAESLTEVQWDLVVIDESHLLTGQRRNLAERLIEGGDAARSLLLTQIPSEPLPGISRLVWQRKDLVDWNGKPLFKVLTKRAVMIEYKRTKEEQRFLQTLERFTGELVQQTQAGRIHGPLLVRAASSSIFTAETMLRRLLETWRPIRNRLAHGMGIAPDDLLDSQRLLNSLLDETEPLDVPEQINIDAQTLVILNRELENLVDVIDEISADSKLDALSSYLGNRWRENKRAHMCVWTSFVSTVQYVASSLEDLEMPLFVLTSAVDWDIRRQRVDDYSKKGGILITTDVAADEITGGIALGFVDECVNFDLPESRDKFEQRWGRFLRISRTTGFDMVFLRDTSKSLAWEEVVFRLIGRSG